MGVTNRIQARIVDMLVTSSRTDSRRVDGESVGADPPLVSVVVPTYGRSPELFAAAIESVHDQTYENMELIVVDDSPEEVSEWVADLDDFDRVERVCDGNHDGAAAARNSGIWQARGEYIAFLDDDDRWMPEKTERQVARFRAAADDVGVVYTGLQYVCDGQIIRQSDASTTGDVTRDILTGANLGTFSTLMVRASLLPQVGFVDPNLPILEDREWCLRISQHCRFDSIEEPLVAYVRGDHEQLTDGYEQLRDVAVPRFEEKHRDLAAGYGPEVERAFRCALRRVCAVSALSAGRYDEARRHSMRALWHQPGDRLAWTYMIAASGGPYTYRPLRAVRRYVSRLQDGLTAR